MTDDTNVILTSESPTDQEELADMILTYVEMAHDCEINKNDEGAFFLYKGANDALVDLMDCDSARQES